VALKTTYIENVKFKIIKISTGQYVGHFTIAKTEIEPHKTFDWAVCAPRATGWT